MALCATVHMLVSEGPLYRPLYDATMGVWESGTVPYINLRAVFAKLLTCCVTNSRFECRPAWVQKV